MYGSMYLFVGLACFLWHERKHDLQRLHLLVGSHLYFVGGHGGHFDLPPQFLLSIGIGLGLGSGGLGGNFGPGIREPEAERVPIAEGALQGLLQLDDDFEGLLHGDFDRGHGSRFPTCLGCLHFLQHDTAAIKTNSWSTRSSIFASLKGFK